MAAVKSMLNLFAQTSKLRPLEYTVESSAKIVGSVVRIQGRSLTKIRKRIGRITVACRIPDFMMRQQ